MRNFFVIFGAALAAVIVRDKYQEHKYKVTMTDGPTPPPTENIDEVD